MGVDFSVLLSVIEKSGRERYKVYDDTYKPAVETHKILWSGNVKEFLKLFSYSKATVEEHRLGSAERSDAVMRM